ncbi:MULTISPECIES: isoprenyl transferase [Spirosoma]|uniref:Isoprenyl transferase n=1 Tax=Spirosoma liriopis TaxID=2937440 RepID=A0ABT0HJB7_9BACT|nr:MULTISPECIES: isoprenyl transferase [Spirosoma]MCK8492231.1 isoprenyl transferase [Spirosoma liriopis]UHG91646.1 isoprenyl transferase [Spirosoma oryzicola]
MKELIDPSNLPQHIAVIMDGNGRWAKRQGAARVFGHRNAIKAVREVTEGCAELGVKFLTLYAFSTENWNRPKFEIDALMTLLVHTIRGEIKTLMNNNVRLTTIGNTESLPGDCQRELAEAMRETAGNTGLTLILALSYSGRWEILEAVRQIATDVRDGRMTTDDINETLFGHYLTTDGIPDPELMIRTSGEMRISNFLLWQLAYSELYMPDVLWPDFRKNHLYEAILNYQKRERRFGKTSEQLVK